MTTTRSPRRALLTRALYAAMLVRASAIAGSAAVALQAGTSPVAAAPNPANPSISRTGSPVALYIPNAAIAAPVETVWLSPSLSTAADRIALDGAQHEIGLPSSPHAAGWFALSAIPGQPGSAILVGHVDTVSGPAIFTRLPQLRLGAEIALELEGSSPATFVVDSTRRHPAHLPAPADLFTLDGPSRLHLVTCIGSFIRAAGGYQDRLIVSATYLPPAIPAEPDLQLDVEEALQPS